MRKSNNDYVWILDYSDVCFVPIILSLNPDNLFVTIFSFENKQRLKDFILKWSNLNIKLFYQILENQADYVYIYE